jgi:predicted nucleic acid-binding Zn ribbon protein
MPQDRRRPSRPASSARRRVLAQWRGIDLSSKEEARAVRARSAESLVSTVLGELRLDRRRSEIEILKVWNHLLDPNIVAHAQPTGLRNGTLFVAVDSSVWLSEIVRYRRKEILERLRHTFGREMIARISFHIA